MSLEVRNKPNENINLVVKNWQNNDTLEEIVKYEYRKLNKSEFTEDDIEILRSERLKFLGDWKDLCKTTKFSERSNKYNDGLVLLLDKVAGIEPENEEEETPATEEKCCGWNKKTLKAIVIVVTSALYLIIYFTILALLIWSATVEGTSIYTVLWNLGPWSLIALIAMYTFITTLIATLCEKENKN
eukprot:gene9109-1200_t